MLAGALAPAVAAEPPRSEFEKPEGPPWTTHKNEVAFLEAVEDASKRVEVDVIGKTKGGLLIRFSQRARHFKSGRRETRT